jgi:hypothetical protein
VRRQQLTVAGNGAKIGYVFLGATATDAQLYRREVRDTIREKKINLFLQEDWEDGAEDVVTLCERRLRDMSDAYLGIFGFRYGWVPPGHKTSITELECFWALDRWPRHQPCPVFLFQPQARSEADAYLREQADDVLRREFPGAPKTWRKNKQDQQAFLKRLAGEYRRITFFTNKHDLCVRAWNAIRHWNGDVLDEATSGGARSPTPAVPPSLLGAIDNKTQRRELSRALTALKAAPECPGICVLAHGERGMGQHEFLCFLDDWFRDDWDGWKPRAQVHDLILPHPPWTPSSLLRTILAQLAPGQQVQGDLPAAVAAVVLRRCADRPQVLRLSEVDALEGGVGAFGHEIWTPLFKALSAQRQPVIHKQRLAVIATANHGELSLSSLDLALGGVVLLPAFVPFDPGDVCEWLRGACRTWILEWLDSDEVEGEPLGEQARELVTNMVLSGGCRPSEVFERLAMTKLWSTPD